MPWTVVTRVACPLYVDFLVVLPAGERRAVRRHCSIRGAYPDLVRHRPSGIFVDGSVLTRPTPVFGILEPGALDRDLSRYA